MTEKLPEGAALVALDPGGLKLARTLKPLLPGAQVHGLQGRTEGADQVFADVAGHLCGLFGQSRPIVGICAAGILIRALAPVLGDKRLDPPVVALAQDGGFSVPLLGGHRGANRLARAVAEATGGQAALTTAGDVRLGLALDDPPPGWRVQNPEAAKAVTQALLAGGPVGLEVDAGDAGWITDSGAEFTGGASLPAATRVCPNDSLAPSVAGFSSPRTWRHALSVRRRSDSASSSLPECHRTRPSLTFASSVT